MIKVVERKDTSGIKLDELIFIKKLGQILLNNTYDTYLYLFLINKKLRLWTVWFGLSY